METFEVEAELSNGSSTIYVMPFVHSEDMPSTAFSLVFDGVEAGTIYKGEDSIWECLESTPWDKEDVQIIGYQIETYYTDSGATTESR